MNELVVFVGLSSIAMGVFWMVVAWRALRALEEIAASLKRPLPSKEEWRHQAAMQALSRRGQEEEAGADGSPGPPGPG